MTIVEHPRTPANLFGRVKALLLHPAPTWDEIEGEPATIKGLLLGYVAPLAAIGPVCQAVGRLTFGERGSLGLVYRPLPARTVGIAVLEWLFTLVAVVGFALAIEHLAPYFDARKDRLKSFKLAAYAGTAAWVFGVFTLHPALAPVAILGLVYTLFLLYLGLPRLLKATGDKELVFLVCAVIVGCGVGFLADILSRLLMGPLSALTSPPAG